VGCRVSNNDDGTVTVDCGDGTGFTVGCSVDQNDDGTATIRCTDGSSATVGEPAEPPPLDDTTAVRGRVTDVAGEAVAGATVSGGGGETVTDAQGRYELAIAAADGVRLEFSAAGFIRSLRTVHVVEGAPTMVHVGLMAAGPAQAFDADVGGRVESGGGAVVLPAGGVVDGDGQPIRGQAEVSITAIDPSDAAQMDNLPGSMMGDAEGGEQRLLESFGMLAVELSRDGQPLQIADGRQATIEIPVPETLAPGEALPAEVPLWHLNTATNRWEADGVATLDAEDNVYRGQVGHFSIWNVDRMLSTGCIRGHVFDRFNRPVRGAHIASRGVNYRGQSRTTSGDDGEFFMGIRLAGEARVRAQHAELDNGRGQIVRGGDVVARIPLEGWRDNCIDVGRLHIARAPGGVAVIEPPDEPPEADVCDEPGLIQIGRDVETVIGADTLPIAVGCGPDGRVTRGEVRGFMAQRNGPACFATIGSQVDTILALRDGRCTDANELACNDDWRGLHSLIQVDLTRQTFYFLAMASLGPGPVRVLSRYGACPAPSGPCEDNAGCERGACVAGQCYEF